MNRLVTPCDTGSCIALEWLADKLVLSTTNGGSQVAVTADEVRTFAAAVASGHFDKLLGGGPDRAAGESAEAILTAHQRQDYRSCLCGWDELGRSHPAHQVAMLREAALLGGGPGLGFVL